MYLFLKAKKKKVVVETVGNRNILFDGESENADPDIKTCLSDCEVIFLCDPRESCNTIFEQAVAVLILFVSPSDAKWKSFGFKRLHYFAFYMPPWDKDELSQCIERCYPDISNNFSDL